MRSAGNESGNAFDKDRERKISRFSPAQSRLSRVANNTISNTRGRTTSSKSAGNEGNRDNRRNGSSERKNSISSISPKNNSQSHNQEQEESFGALFQKSARSFLGGNLAKGESFSIMKAIGGVRGAIESILPAFIFILLFTITRSLLWTVVVSLGIAIIALIVRLAMREQLRSTIFGLVFVLICLASAWFSHNAKNFYLPGFIVDTIAIIFLVVLLVCQLPFIGIIVEVFHTPMSNGIKEWWRTWRYNKSLYWCYIWGTLVWVGLFACRLIVELPFYFTGNIAWLGTLRLALGVPLYVLAVWLTWAIVTPQVRKYDAEQEEEEDIEDSENNSRLIYNAELAQIEGKDVVSRFKNSQDTFQVDIERPWSNKHNPDYKELNFSDSDNSYNKRAHQSAEQPSRVSQARTSQPHMSQPHMSEMRSSYKNSYDQEVRPQKSYDWEFLNQKPFDRESLSSEENLLTQGSSKRSFGEDSPSVSSSQRASNQSMGSLSSQGMSSKVASSELTSSKLAPSELAPSEFLSPESTSLKSISSEPSSLKSASSPLDSRFSEPSSTEFVPADSSLSEIYSSAFSFNDDIQPQNIPQFGGVGPKSSFYNQDLSQDISLPHSENSQTAPPRSDTMMAFKKAINDDNDNSRRDDDYFAHNEKNKKKSTDVQQRDDQQEFYDFNEEPETFSSPFNIALPGDKDLDFK